MEKKNNLYNSTYEVKAIDAYALGYALANTSEIENVRIVKDGEQYKLKFRYSHYAMNGYGEHIGYENVDFYLPCHEKAYYGISGVPYAISGLIVFLNQLEIESTECPDKEFPDKDSHDKNCAVHDEKFDDWDWDEDPWNEECDCGLNEFWEGYIPPEWDYFYDTMDNVFHMIEEFVMLPNFEFDMETRTWNIMDREFNIDKNEIPNIEWEF